jgi:hypothetical protein
MKVAAGLLNHDICIDFLARDVSFYRIAFDQSD